MLVVFFLFAFFMSESYEVRNAELWAKSLNDLIMYVKCFNGHKISQKTR